MTSRWFKIGKRYHNLDAFSEFKIGTLDEGKYPVFGVLKTPRGNTLNEQRVTLKKFKTQVDASSFIVDILKGEYDVDVKPPGPYTLY